MPYNREAHCFHFEGTLNGCLLGTILSKAEEKAKYIATKGPPFVNFYLNAAELNESSFVSDRFVRFLLTLLVCS